jgi:putative phosphoribosyl transferase
MAFGTRADAGRCLGHRLGHRRGGDTVVVGVACGGVWVARAVAEVLAAPLDVVVAQRVVDPFLPSRTVGAVVDGVVATVDVPVPRGAGFSLERLPLATEALAADVERRARRIRGGRAPENLDGRTAVVVDDGVLTGMTARAACRAVRVRGAQRVVLAVPVASLDAMIGLQDVAEEIVCIHTPQWMPGGLSRWYREFPPVTDDDVAEVLRRHAATGGSAQATA